MTRRSQERAPPPGSPGPKGPVTPTRQQGGGRGAAVLAVRDGDETRGPMVMAVAILAFIGSSFLAVHLRYLPDASTTAVRPLGALPALATAPSAPPPTAPRAGPSRPGEGTSDLPGAPNLGVVPVPMPAAAGEWDRKVSECIERTARERGGGDVKPVLPGRWPALKRAREERRLHRLALRTACEQELSR